MYDKKDVIITCLSMDTIIHVFMFNAVKSDLKFSIINELTGG